MEAEPWPLVAQGLFLGFDLETSLRQSSTVCVSLSQAHWLCVSWSKVWWGEKACEFCWSVLAFGFVAVLFLFPKAGCPEQTAGHGGRS